MTYETRNQKAIATLHPAMQIKVNQFIENLKEVGEDILITDASRTSEEQDALYAQGRRTRGKIVTHVDDSNSFHTHGLAIDVVPVGPLGVPLSKRWYLDWAAHGRYQNIAREAQEVGLTWGYKVWGFDKPHFHYTQGLSIADLKRGREPDVGRAKAEWIGELQRKLNIAIRAKDAYWVQPDRQAEIVSEIKMLRRKIERLQDVVE